MCALFPENPEVSAALRDKFLDGCMSWLQNGILLTYFPTENSRETEKGAIVPAINLGFVQIMDNIY